MFSWVKNLMQNNHSPPEKKAERVITGKKQMKNGTLDGAVALATEATTESCEAAAGEEQINGQTLEANIAEKPQSIIALLFGQEDSNYVTLMPSNGKEFRVQLKNFKAEPICGRHYKLEGHFLEKSQTFVPNSVVELSEESNSLHIERDDLLRDKLSNKCTINTFAEMGVEQLIQKIFNSVEAKEEITPIKSEIFEDSQANEVRSSKTDSSGTYAKEEEIIPIKGEIFEGSQTEDIVRSVKTNSSETYESLPCSSSSFENTTPTLVPNKFPIFAVVLNIENGGNVFMFSVDKTNVPFFYVPISSLDAPTNIGNWYELILPDDHQQKSGNVSDIPLLEPLEKGKPCPAGQKPLRTRLANGTVQLCVEVKLGERTNHGFLTCYSDNFPPILDSGGFLNDDSFGKTTVENPEIRNAPTTKIVVRCSARKYPIDGIYYWKVAGVESKIREKKRKQEQEEKAEEKPLPPPPQTPPAPLIRNAPKLMAANAENTALSEIVDGLVCSQTDTDFLIYSMKPWIACLDKRRAGNDNILGMWIRFQIRDENGTKVVDDNFEFIRAPSPGLHAIPTQDYVLIRCSVQIPRPLESDWNPWCESLRAIVFDDHELLRSQHWGKTVEATVGTPAYAFNSDPHWQLLHVEDF